jgi:hypothetical protein
MEETTELVFQATCVWTGVGGTFDGLGKTLIEKVGWNNIRRGEYKTRPSVTENGKQVLEFDI